MARRSRSIAIVALVVLLGVGSDVVLRSAPASSPTPSVGADPDAALPAVPLGDGESESEAEAEEGEEARERVTPRPPGLAFGSRDPLVATVGSTVGVTAVAMPPTRSSWDGLGEGMAGYPVGVFGVPPDPALDVSRTQVVEAVNHAYAVWSKTGELLKGPLGVRSLWTGYGGTCETNADGDPTVTYDRLADRWVLMQLAYNTADGKTTPFRLCVAVSSTSDATGAWYRSSFDYAVLPDYPKLSVWRDAYYVSFNGYKKSGSGWSWDAAQVCALERAAMLTGSSPSQQCWTLPATSSSPLVATVEGRVPPPANRPAYVLALGGTGKVDSWRIAVDWTTAANSTFTGPTSIAVADYALACSGVGPCIPQPGTGQQLEAQGDRLMHRVVYRNLGTREALYATHSISNTGVSGIRWYELRAGAAGGDPQLVQQGTHAPDGDHRWLPAMASDHRGDLALLYTTGSASLYPSIRAAGRLVEETAGTLGQGETTLMAGGGSQQAISRWGDYASLVGDPGDDCTFWGASQYEATTGSYNWRTRIVSFTFAACLAVSPRLTVTYAGDGAGLVASSPVGLSCVASCAAGLGWGTPVTLSVETTAGSRFAGWSGACSGTGACSVTMDASQGVTATFQKVPLVTLTAPATPTRATSFTYALTSGDAIADLTVGDFVVRGTATGCAVTSVASTKRGGTAWSVAVGGCSDGTVALSLLANAVTGPNGVRGPIADSSAGTVTVDRLAPFVAAPVAAPSPVTAGSVVSVSVDASDGTGVKAASASIAGGAWSSLTSTGYGRSPVVATGTLTAPAIAGTYTVCARATDLLDQTSGSACTPLVVGALTTLTLVSPTDITTGATRTYTARLAEAGSATPVAGRPVTFTFGTGRTQAVLSATTNSAGDASVTWSAPTSAGSVPLTLSHAANAQYGASSASITLLVRTATVLTYTGGTSVTAGAAITLTGTLRTAGGSAVSGQSVTFLLTGTGYSQSSVRTSSSTGALSWAITAPAAGSYTITLTFAGTSTYQPSAASATLTTR